jgi:hypothetical protein
MEHRFSQGTLANGLSGNDQRASPRKPLKTRAVLTVKGAAPLAVRTFDISAQGVCLTFLQPLPVGLTGALTIDLLIDGKPHTLTMQARTAYCIFSGGQYKVGFQFTGLDMATVTLLAKFLR